MTVRSTPAKAASAGIVTSYTDDAAAQARAERLGELDGDLAEGALAVEEVLGGGRVEDADDRADRVVLVAVERDRADEGELAPLGRADDGVGLADDELVLGRRVDVEVELVGPLGRTPGFLDEL